MLSLVRYALVIPCMLASGAVGAQGFAALVSPPRFEGAAKPGETYRNVVEVTNAGAESANYHLQTADWRLEADGSVTFNEELAEGSCRPWVGLEAANINLGAGTKRRYRFEVAVPADAPFGECRFAILLEGDPGKAGGGVPVPVAGRIGIIVYLTIGSASANLTISSASVKSVQERLLPVLQVRNDGNAHGRLEGLLDGTDANGHRYALTPSSLPILPGETRATTLTPEPSGEGFAAPVISYPLRLKGRLDSGTQRIDIDATVDK